MRRRSIFVAAVLSAALVIVGAPAPAQADDILRVNGVYNDSTGHRGILFVSVTSTQPVAELRAEVVTEDTGAPVAEFEDFVLQSQTSDAAIWASTVPLIRDAPGEFVVHVAVTDVAGNHLRQERAGLMLYYVETFLDEVTVDRGSVNYDDRQVTISGTLKGRWPGTGEIRPLAGFPVSISEGFGHHEAIAAADGTFSKTLTVYGSSPELSARYVLSLDRPYVDLSQEVRFPLAIDPRQTRLAVKTDRTKVVAGQSVRLSGQLSWLTPSGWKPLPNEISAIYFTLYDDNGGYVAYGNLDTDAKGRFTVDIPPPRTGYFHFVYQPLDPYVAPTEGRTKTVTVLPTHP
ncbi:hypothetical protein E0H26_03975 [Micromonospora zingiberis]|uniref:Uncharacterized protein n=1 Tax=Micromonospora zingiberis TaxID=2053011 RepID=A0A4R0GUU4_9ACTN|nr:hypothetical protein [Micromonospora zingiberis]TCB99719.1 hypothetical protein E0H26_03975 [Micromonospora zingiberis]